MKVPRKLSIFYEGKWSFFQLSSSALRRETEFYKYYIMSTPFGILEKTETNPRNTIKRGSAGDYLVIDYNNVLGVMNKETYQALYNEPRPSPQVTGDISYRELNNQDFYAENVRNQPR